MPNDLVHSTISQSSKRAHFFFFFARYRPPVIPAIPEAEVKSFPEVEPNLRYIQAVRSLSGKFRPHIFLCFLWSLCTFPICWVLQSDDFSSLGYIRKEWCSAVNYYYQVFPVVLPKAMGLKLEIPAILCLKEIGQTASPLTSQELQKQFVAFSILYWFCKDLYNISHMVLSLYVYNIYHVLLCKILICNV